MFNMKKIAITPLPSASSQETKLIFIKHYRAVSDAWKDNAQCFPCQWEYMRDVQPFTSCRQPNFCACNIFNRQPPSLKAMASRAVFNFVYNLERFESTADTTYSEYKFAFTSKRVRLVPVPTMNLLPPEYPFTEIIFCFRCPLYKLHHGRGSWHGQFNNVFSTTSDAINALVNDKDRFWCRFCKRPLFFPRSCPDHL